MNLTWENVGVGHYRIKLLTQIHFWIHDKVFLFRLKGPWSLVLVKVIFVSQCLAEKNLRKKYQFKMVIVVWLPGARPGVWCDVESSGWYFPRGMPGAGPGRAVSSVQGARLLHNLCALAALKWPWHSFSFPGRAPAHLSCTNQARSLRTTCSKLSQPGSVTRGGGGLKFKNCM